MTKFLHQLNQVNMFSKTLIAMALVSSMAPMAFTNGSPGFNITWKIIPYPTYETAFDVNITNPWDARLTKSADLWRDILPKVRNVATVYDWYNTSLTINGLREVRPTNGRLTFTIPPQTTHKYRFLPTLSCSP